MIREFIPIHEYQEIFGDTPEKLQVDAEDVYQDAQFRELIINDLYDYITRRVKSPLSPEEFHKSIYLPTEGSFNKSRLWHWYHLKLIKIGDIYFADGGVRLRMISLTEYGIDRVTLAGL